MVQDKEKGQQILNKKENKFGEKKFESFSVPFY